MSAHYLIDPFTLGGTILDVVVSESGQTACTGALVIRIADGVPIDASPFDLDTLLSAKSKGLLALHTGYTALVTDPCLNGGVDTSVSSGVMIGSGASQHCIFPSGTLVTTKRQLGSTPGRCLVTWEAYSFLDDDPIDGRFTRQYVEEDAGGVLACEISFGGGPFGIVRDGIGASLPLAGQGSDVVLRFSNGGHSRVYLGSWSVLY